MIKVMEENMKYITVKPHNYYPNRFHVNDRCFEISEYWRTETVYIDDINFNDKLTVEDWNLIDVSVNAVPHPLMGDRVLGRLVLCFKKRKKLCYRYATVYFSVDVETCDEFGYSTCWEVEDTIEKLEKLNLKELEINES